MAALEFFIPVEPPRKTAQSGKQAGVKKNGKAYVYDTRELKQIRADFIAQLSPHAPKVPYQGAIQCVTKWCWPTNSRHVNPEWKDTKPDTDNLIKAFKDAMTKTNFWEDDAQVCDEHIQKFWADPAGIWVHIEELERL